MEAPQSGDGMFTCNYWEVSWANLQADLEKGHEIRLYIPAVRHGPMVSQSQECHPVKCAWYIYGKNMILHIYYLHISIIIYIHVVSTWTDACACLYDFVGMWPLTNWMHIQIMSASRSSSPPEMRPAPLVSCFVEPWKQDRSMTVYGRPMGRCGSPRLMEPLVKPKIDEMLADGCSSLVNLVELIVLIHSHSSISSEIV